MSKSKTIEQLTNEAIKETTTPAFAEMLKDETNAKIFIIMAKIAEKRGDKGPMEFSLMMGRECFEQGREEMRKELFENLEPSRAE